MNNSYPAGTIEEINLQQINESDIQKKSIELYNYLKIITVGTDTQKIAEIIKRIELWRKQSECWLICIYILSSAIPQPTHADADIYFSVLNILLHKLQSDFYQLPSELHGRLRDVLFAFLRSLSQHHIRQPLAKLSEAVAALSLQMEGWPAPVDDVIRMFGGTAAEAPCAIHALMFMPEISTKENVRVRSGRRKEYAAYLNRELGKVFEFLKCWLQNSGSDEELQGLIFKCLREWFYTCGVSLEIVKSSPLTAAMFLALSKPNLFDTAIDCICELVSVANDSSDRNPLRDYIINQMIEIAPKISGLNNIEQLRGYCRAFSEVGSTYRSYLATGTPAALKFAGIALDIAKIPDAKCCSDISLFFYDLADEFSIGRHRGTGLSCNGGGGDDDDDDDYYSSSSSSSDSDDINNDVINQTTTTTTTTTNTSSTTSSTTSNHHHHHSHSHSGHRRHRRPSVPLNYDAYTELYKLLVQVLVTHLVLPSDYEELDEDEQDNIKDFRRYAIGQTLRSCSCVIGDEELLRLVLEIYSSALLAYDGREWRGVEAAVYALRSIARCVPIDHEHSADSPIKAFFETLPRLPQAPLLQYTAILVVGRYADWLRFTPAALPPMLTYITRALQAPGPAAPAAALAFLHICEACRKELVCYAEDIFKLVKGMLEADALGAAGAAALVAKFGKDGDADDGNSGGNSGCAGLDHVNVEDVVNGAGRVFGLLKVADIARILSDLVVSHSAAIQTLLAALSAQQGNSHASLPQSQHSTPSPSPPAASPTLLSASPLTSTPTSTSLPAPTTPTTAASNTTNNTIFLNPTNINININTNTNININNNVNNNNNNNSNSNGRIAQREIAASIVALLRRMGTLFKYIYPEYELSAGEEHPTITAFGRVFETVKALYSSPLRADDAVVEQVCRCLRGVVTSAYDRVAPLLLPLLEMVINVFSVAPSSSILYLLNVVVECTCENPQLRPVLAEAFFHASNTVFQLSRSRDALATNPVLISEYFELAILCMAKVDISQTAFVENILHLGIGAIQAIQLGGVKSVLKFFAELLHLAKAPRRADLRAIIAGALPSIVHSLLVCAAETQDRRVLALVVRIIRSFTAIDKAAFMNGVAACLGLSCSDGVIAAVPRGAPLPQCGEFPYRTDFRARSELYGALEVSCKSSQITAALEQFHLVCKSS